MVYVGKNQYPLGRMKMCHMVASTLDELHLIAGKIGVDRRHFQDKPGKHPHYDVCLAKKKLAIEIGAEEVSDKDIVTFLKKNYLSIRIEPHFAGNYRIEYDGKYVSLYGLDNRYDMAGLFGTPEGTFDEMVLIPVAMEVRDASPVIRAVTEKFIEIEIFNKNGKI